MDHGLGGDSQRCNGATEVSCHNVDSCKLSICITTFNRGALIGQTLDSMLCQIDHTCEVVVLDGASSDQTEAVLADYSARYPALRYFRGATNNGFDRDCDECIRLARGEFCWLMTDDDVLLPGAVARVLGELKSDISLIFTNLELRTFDLLKVVQDRYLRIDTTERFGPNEMDRLFTVMGDVAMYVGGFIVRRSLWMERNREPYYGSWFIHVGVIFQAPLPGDALIVAEPQIAYRSGNTHTFSPLRIELKFLRWPLLVKSLCISEAAKKRVPSTEPWRHLRHLIRMRAMGHYTLDEYQRWVRPQLNRSINRVLPKAVALMPGALVNTILLVLYSILPRMGARRQLMRESRFFWLRALRVRNTSR